MEAGFISSVYPELFHNHKLLFDFDEIKKPPACEDEWLYLFEKMFESVFINDYKNYSETTSKPNSIITSLCNLILAV